MSRQRPDDWPIDWPVQAGAVDDVLAALDSRLQRRRAVRRRRQRVAVAICGLLLVGGAGGLVRQATSNLSDSTRATTTGSATTLVAQPERQVLADGSVVELKPGARIHVAFSVTQRRVELAEGEAHFEVTKDPQRPFIVEAGNVWFRAVGTAFSVQKANGAVELFVTEGRVAVDQPAATERSSGIVGSVTQGATTADAAAHQTLAIVEAGHRMLVAADVDAHSPHAPQIVPVPSAQASQRLAWRVPTLDLSGTPLGEALPHFNRHGKVRLTLGDRELAQVRLSGMIRADNIETLLALLADSYGVRAESRSDGEIVLRKRR